MNKKARRADILLLLTASIWGFGFVAQRSGMEFIGPFAFNGIRFIMGSVSLLPIIIFRRMAIPAGLPGSFVPSRPGLKYACCPKSAIPAGLPRSFAPSRPGLKDTCCPKRCKTPAYNQRLLPASLAAGGCLFIAVIFQQFGVLFTTAGNAGFITGFYVVLTPIFGIFLGKKTRPATWLGAFFTITGLYFLSVAGNSSSINPGDILILASAFFWSLHVLLIDRLMHKKSASQNSSHGSPLEPQPRPKAEGSPLDPFEFSAGQFAVCGVLALAGAFFAEPYVGAAIESINPDLLDTGLFAWLPFPALIKSGAPFPAKALIPIIYGGLGSVGIAYTLQVIAQRDAPPAHTTIILCFEGCFAALGGAILLSEKIGFWTLLGFSLMLAGMLISQWGTGYSARQGEQAPPASPNGYPAEK